MMLPILLSILVAGQEKGPGTYTPDSVTVEIPRRDAKKAAAEVHWPKEAKGALPTIVLSPGGQASSFRGYGSYGKLFAEWGYVTVVVAFDNASAKERGKQYSEVLDWLKKKNVEKDGKLKGRIDFKNLVAAGHSRGGYAAVVAAKGDKRFKACLAIAPSGPAKLEGDNDPIFFFVSGDNGDERTCARLYKQAKPTRWQVTVEGMDHFLQPREKGTILNGCVLAVLNYTFRGARRYKDGMMKTAKGVKVVVEEKK